MSEPIQQLADTSVLPSNGATKQTPISSTSTLFWRIFIPVFSTVILTGFLLAFWLISEEDLYLSFPALYARLAITILWAAWIFFLYRTLWRLKRIDADSVHLFVTDYWTTVRYPWTDVEKYTETRRLGRTIGHFHLKAAGRFGKTISILPARHKKQWMIDHGLGDLLP
jgi:hypothetical protein